MAWKPADVVTGVLSVVHCRQERAGGEMPMRVARKKGAFSHSRATKRRVVGGNGFQAPDKTGGTAETNVVISTDLI